MNIYQLQKEFLKILLNLERVEENKKKGYINDVSEASLFYQLLMVKPIIHLYYGCKTDNDISSANEIYNFMLRHALWVRDEVYTNWKYGPYDTPVTGGSFGTGDLSGKYFPYGIRNSYWVKNEPWPRDVSGSKYTNPWYSGNYADLFAFIFSVTNDQEWLNLARSVYKDAWSYGTSAGEWVDIKDTSSFTYPGIYENPKSGWLKDAMHLTKPMYYLHVEEKNSN